MDLHASLEIVTEKLQNWLTGIVEMLPNLVVAVLVLILFLIISRIAKKVSFKVLNKFVQSKAVSRLISTIISVSFIIVGVIIALGVLKLEKTVTSLLAGAGIIGLALSFAFQDIASNFISGVLIAIRKPFVVGDIVESTDYFGTVEKINLRYTIIKTFQGNNVLIPNKDIYENPLINYTMSTERRIDLSVGVSYGDDLDKVKKVTLDTINSMDNIARKDDVTLFYTGFGDSSINFDVRFWVDYSRSHSDFLEARSDAIMKIKKAFDENDITIPFPIRTLDFGIKGGEKLSEMELQTKTMNKAS